MDELTRCMRDARRSARLTQQDVADRTGISKTDYVRIESGLFVLLDKETISRIAGVVGMDPHLLNSLYLAAFSSDLRKLKKKKTAVNGGTIDITSESKEKTEGSGNSELSALFQSILSLPDDKKKYMADTIRMVMSNVFIGAA